MRKHRRSFEKDESVPRREAGAFPRSSVHAVGKNEIPLMVLFPVTPLICRQRPRVSECFVSGINKNESTVVGSQSRGHLSRHATYTEHHVYVDGFSQTTLQRLRLERKTVPRALDW